ncbi:PAS domain-containing protein [Megalodesulfovibrio gigas]|uniref:Putative PAS:Histidine kinase A-like protein n=1 Tax=Megalodesulfovibrio gigas (strain ATCC 19364 / DSM 1382 / NCIMB 9332 / VKM B-1759) TaxID=1121448 RepID=T2GE56_MEGG1|nr:PAS domain-containing protein [Megalodesulfovibrio gigas]AGW14182.1 putative PAS:Histidine kinase A-like protein [Megalodesulfovibrio gigas DSM 1382 = ATCC 19364]
MKKNKQYMEELRKKAESIKKSIATNKIEYDASESKKIIHDLQTYQIELELQNEDLRNTQQELERTRSMFSRLFDNAPVGYITIDEFGIIHQANQTFAELVAMPHGSLLRKPFSRFILDEDSPIFLSRFRAFFSKPGGKTMDVRLSRATSFFFCQA